MRHKLFTFATALSLTLCVGTAAMGVRSYWHVDYYSWQDERRIPPIKIPAGLFPTTLPNGMPMPTTMGRSYGPKPLMYSENGWIVYVRDMFYDPTTGEHYVRTLQFPISLPYCLLVILTGALPAHWILVRRTPQAEVRRSRGLCLKCGYDLRATPDRCPECGSISPPKQ